MVVMLSGIFFNASSLVLIDNSLDTKVEVSVEEKGSEKKSDNNLIADTSFFYVKEIKVFADFDFSIPILNQLYLNNIFKPPISFNA